MELYFFGFALRVWETNNLGDISFCRISGSNVDDIISYMYIREGLPIGFCDSLCRSFGGLHVKHLNGCTYGRLDGKEDWIVDRL